MTSSPLDPPATIDPTSKAAVTVYGADWCGDCVRSKALLERVGVPYVWVDLVAEPEQTAEVLRRNAGRQSIPVVVFPDDSHLTEPSDPELRARLADLGLLPA